MIPLVKKGISLLILMLGLFLVGTVGFLSIEEGKWTVLDSLYFTLITLATIGYSEVHTLSESERLFTIFLIVSGVIITYYIASTVAELILEGKLNKYLARVKMTRGIDKLSNHYIVCGYGRIGDYICEELARNKLPFVVLETKEERVDLLKSRNWNYIDIDATQDKGLLEAGIERAKALVIVVGNDADSVFVALSGRYLNPKIYILARYEEVGNDAKLLKAGADRVLSPHIVSGGRMVDLLLEREGVDASSYALLNKLEGFSLQEIGLKPTSELLGKRLIELERYGLLVVAVLGGGKGVRFKPMETDELSLEASYLVLGKLKDINRLKEEKHLQRV